MDEYFIGAGAVLTAGAEASIADATIHARTTRQVAREVEAAVFDFEAGPGGDLSRIVLAAAGWSGERFRTEVVVPLLAKRDCSLGDVVAALAKAVGTADVHLFARWLPDEATLTDLTARGIGLLVHPLEAIGQAALVSGQRLERWAAPFRAA